MQTVRPQKETIKYNNPTHNFSCSWTGKEFHKPPDAPLDDKLRNEYIETLIRILENGFEMRRGREEIHDLNGKLLETFISRVCFTEI